MNLTIEPIRARQIMLQTLIVLGLAFGAIAISHRPEGALVWITGMLTLPLAWLLVFAAGALPGPDRPKQRREIYSSLVFAGLLLTSALGVAAAVTIEVLPEDWSTRFGLLTSALVLIIIGNSLPKKIEPGCPRTRALAIQRLLGWTFVITGLAAAIVWLVAPMQWAMPVGLTIYAIASAVCLFAVFRIRAT